MTKDADRSIISFIQITYNFKITDTSAILIYLENIFVAAANYLFNLSEKTSLWYLLIIYLIYLERTIFVASVNYLFNLSGKNIFVASFNYLFNLSEKHLWGIY